MRQVGRRRRVGASGAIFFEKTSVEGRAIYRRAGEVSM